ncbi:MAG: hypothetical protein QOI57_2998 [Rubrobacteraceae bacterium]|nr:hypothetical protein [Rubrobacteraceae bacterium]
MIMLILSSYDALQVVPVNSIGVALVLLAFVLLVGDLKVTNHGLPILGGLVALVLGVLMLFNTMALYLWALSRQGAGRGQLSRLDIRAR